MSKWLRKTISPQDTDTHNKKTQKPPPKLLCYFAKILPKKNWAEHLNAALAAGGKGEEGKEYDIYEPFFKSSNAWRVVGEGGGEEGENL